ncbi:MAG: hypothetical protein ABSG46_06450 [Candidatus Binataceae bacterium]|jgi:DNA-binding beta-propeller fold protein YncE
MSIQAGSNRAAIPSAVISGPDTGLGTGEQGSIALNPVNADVYLANLGNNSISVYPAGSNGDVVPTVVIRGPAADISSPEGIALEHSGNIYLVTLFDNVGDPLTGGIAVYAAGVMAMWRQLLRSVDSTQGSALAVQ